MKRLLAIVLAVGLCLVSAPTAEAAIIRTEGFDRADWWRWWGMKKAPFRTAALAEGGRTFLRIGIPAGQHDGTSFFAPTGSADEVTLRYQLRISTSFDPRPSAFDVKLPGFGKPSLDLTGSCIAGCGGAQPAGLDAYSARADINASGTPGFYVYDLDSTLYGRGPRWNLPELTKGVWHRMELRIVMNAPGSANGVLEAKVDGRLVSRTTNNRFRGTPDLHVGNVWFNVYYGGVGLSPTNATFDVDDVVIEAG